MNLKLIFGLFATCIVAASSNYLHAQGEWGPGYSFSDNAPLGSGVFLPSLSVSVEPGFGSLAAIDGTLTYVADPTLIPSADYFEASVIANDGSTLDLVGIVLDGQVSVEFSQTVVNGGVSFSFSGVTYDNNIVSENFIYSEGSTVNVISGQMTVAMYRNILKDLKSWIFPGQVKNQSSVPILVWNNDGFFWLPPNTSTSPSGDYADFVLVNGTWYKVSWDKVTVIDMYPNSQVPTTGWPTTTGPLTPPETDLGGWTPPTVIPTGIPTWGVDYDENTPYPSVTVEETESPPNQP